MLETMTVNVANSLNDPLPHSLYGFHVLTVKDFLYGNGIEFGEVVLSTER